MPSKFKNVAIAGEPASGKTQLCEAIVHKAGVTTRLNAVAKGQSIFDSQKDERERQISIDLALGHFEISPSSVNTSRSPARQSGRARPKTVSVVVQPSFELSGLCAGVG